MARFNGLKWALVGLVASVSLALAMSLVVGWRLSRRATPRATEIAPAEIADRVESLRLATRDGEELGAWYLKPIDAAAPSVILLHGLGSTRASRLAAASVFQGFGSSALLVTLRCHGDSSGEFEDYGWSARHDVIAAVEWMEKRRPASHIIVCGSSLGAAAATFAAHELGSRVAGYVLECPYATLDLAARHRTSLALGHLDVIANVGIEIAAAVFEPHWSDAAPIDAIRAIPATTPVLLFAGERDRRAPPDEVAKIGANVSGEHELVIVPNADHDRLLADGRNEYPNALRDWLERHFARR